MSSWKLRAEVSQIDATSALLRQEEMLDWDADIVVSACEIAPDRPGDWAFEAWLPREPEPEDVAAIESLFEGPKASFTAEKLPETDWVVESQKGVDPIREGRFHVHTPDHGAADGAVNFVIPASLAFGTGQHETTAGCLALLDDMQRAGTKVRNHADIGTGTGLLAFAAMKLWPDARAIASDIDPVCEDVIRINAQMNEIALGTGNGELALVTADGVDDPAIAGRMPFDLLIANILAGPLIELAPAFAAAVAAEGQILLAGLLETQQDAVCEAYAAYGFALHKRLVKGDWSIVWLTREA
jgi:ribosomal protein L11 methyltransferase